MSSHGPRSSYYSRDRDNDDDWDRDDYRNRPPASRKRSRSPLATKRRSRSPRKQGKNVDDAVLRDTSKLPESSDMWESQFQDGGFAPPPPPSFRPEGSSNYNAAYASGAYSGIYDDFPTVPPAPQPPEIGNWNQMCLQPPPPPAPPTFLNNVEDQIKKEAAIESEMRHQKAALSKQREDYMKKANILKKELDTLKDQRNELRGDSKRSPSPDTKRFLKENTKLQLEIQNKLKTINNVVDMLNGIIGEEAQELHESDDSIDKISKRKSRSPSSSRIVGNKKFNYVYYDPEMHWCRVCNEFPATAKDYLNHLHSQAHHKMALSIMEAPWHSLPTMNEGFPNFSNAPTKRTPIKGLQFFVPSTAWYCKLCDQFIGDLHCASAHLKSQIHAKNYTNFVEQNPHWETDWMSDRQKAFEKVRMSTSTKPKPREEEKPQYADHTITFNKDGFHTRRKKSPSHAEESFKNKKKGNKRKTRRRHSTSSSSSRSSSSDSERTKSKKKIKKEKKSDNEEKTLREWMAAIQVDKLNDSDKKMLDNLKSRIKLEKQEHSSERSKERSQSDQRKRESPRHEYDRRDKRERRDEGRKKTERTPPPQTKKPEVKKMPFIGKMPVFKNLAKNLVKSEEQKKDEQKKKEQEEELKKKREAMDLEIQKKVAEFKAKLSNPVPVQTKMDVVPPPGIALPTALGTDKVPQFNPNAPPPAVKTAPQPPVATAPQPQPPPLMLHPVPPPAPLPPVQPPGLPKDFQEALDIIFPAEGCNEGPSKQPQQQQQQDMFNLPPPGFLGGPVNVMPPFVQPLMQPPQVMMGYDMNQQHNMFGPRPQLYDNQVPIMPNQNQRQNQNQNQNQNQKQNKRQKFYQNKIEKKKSAKAASKIEQENGAMARKQEALDELAMLGIDASDVGALV